MLNSKLLRLFIVIPQDPTTFKYQQQPMQHLIQHLYIRWNTENLVFDTRQSTNTKANQTNYVKKKQHDLREKTTTTTTKNWVLTKWWYELIYVMRSPLWTEPMKKHWYFRRLPVRISFSTSIAKQLQLNLVPILTGHKEQYFGSTIYIGLLLAIFCTGNWACISNYYRISTNNCCFKSGQVLIDLFSTISLIYNCLNYDWRIHQKLCVFVKNN